MDREPEPSDYDQAYGPPVTLSPSRRWKEEIMTKQAQQYASIDDLTAETAADGAEDFTLKSGLKVRVRSLTRAEHLWTGKGTEDPAEIDARLISKGLVAPAMSVDAVKKWQTTGSTKVISEISDKIQRLSGFGEEADKSELPAVRDEP